MKNKIFITDIEVAPNFFCATFMDYVTKEKILFEISNRKQDNIFSFYRKLNIKSNKLITFNGNHYDLPVLEFLMTLEYLSMYELKSKVENLCLYNQRPVPTLDFDYEYWLYLLDELSFSIIQGHPDSWWKDLVLYDLKYLNDVKLKSIDLMLYWARMTRLSKKVSLKSLGIQMNYHTIQELPYKPNTILPESKFDEIVHYNYEHDMNLTYMLTKELEPQIKLRKSLNKQFGLDCWSWDAPKIGMELLRKFYKEKTGKTLDITNNTYDLDLKDVILDSIKFQHPENIKLLDKLMNTNVSSTKGLLNTTKIVQPNGMYLISKFGAGGIHGVAFKGILIPKEGEVLLDLDYASYYPSLGEMLQFLSDALPIYSQIKNDRVVSKKLAKSKTLDKASKEYHQLISDVYKLCLNAVYGNLGNFYSGISNLVDLLGITVNGQLILAMLSEELMYKFKCSIVYQNTDGITLVCRKEQVQDIIEYSNNLSQTISTKLVIEEDFFSKMIVKDVNNFINVKENGVIKRKGSFKIPYNEYGSREINLEDSCNNLIVPIAVHEYFIRNTPVRETIENHKNLHNFCLSNKPAKKYSVYWKNEKQQRLNRYYISKKGAYLYKTEDNDKFHNMMKGHSVILANNITDKFPTDIHYQYYISKATKIIEELEPRQMSMF